MTKINKEEYKFLKSLDDKWKWIARNYNGALIIYTSKPMENPNLYWDGFGERMDDRLFQFIQWGEEEPYEIAELIEEYEYKEFYDYVGWKYAESEEPEVNKDIQCLKREIHKELEDWHGVEGGIDGDGINEIMLLINQHEESEVKRLERKIKELDSYNDELIRDNNQLRNELDNQEVLSQEWIDEHSYNVHLLGTPDVETVAIPREDLQNLLVPKQELPVIPKFVAEVIEKDKEHGYDVYDSIDLIIETNGGGLPSISNWVARNIDKYARAWLDGYTVEEEQKYIVSDNSDVPLLIKTDKGKVMSYDSQIAYNNSNGTIELTEQEIKDYDERYWTFAVKVEELE